MVRTCYVKKWFLLVLNMSFEIQVIFDLQVNNVMFSQSTTFTDYNHNSVHFIFPSTEVLALLGFLFFFFDHTMAPSCLWGELHGKVTFWWDNLSNLPQTGLAWPAVGKKRNKTFLSPVAQVPLSPHLRAGQVRPLSYAWTVKPVSTRIVLFTTYPLQDATDFSLLMYSSSSSTFCPNPP